MEYAPTPEFSHTEFTFIREYGTHRFDLHDGQTAAVLSQPTWDTCLAALTELAGSGMTPDYILTPELITTANERLEVIPDERERIEASIQQAQILSQACPDSTLLLGTATFDAISLKPRNSTLFIRNGSILGQTHKQTVTNKEERAIFSESPQENNARPYAQGISFICFDFAQAAVDAIAWSGPEYKPADWADIETVFVSACWAIPPVSTHFLPTNEKRHKEVLRKSSKALFHGYPKLQTIVFADRVPQGSQIHEPLNFCARRPLGR